MVDLSVECRGKEYKNLKVIVLTTGTVVFLCFVALFLFRIQVTAWENRKELLGKLDEFLDESEAIKKLIGSRPNSPSLEPSSEVESYAGVEESKSGDLQAGSLLANAPAGIGAGGDGDVEGDVEEADSYKKFTKILYLMPEEQRICFMYFIGIESSMNTKSKFFWPLIRDVRPEYFYFEFFNMLYRILLTAGTATAFFSDGHSKNLAIYAQTVASIPPFLHVIFPKFDPFIDPIMNR